MLLLVCTVFHFAAKHGVFSQSFKFWSEPTIALSSSHHSNELWQTEDAWFCLYRWTNSRLEVSGSASASAFSFLLFLGDCFGHSNKYSFSAYVWVAVGSSISETWQEVEVKQKALIQFDRKGSSMAEQGNAGMSRVCSKVQSMVNQANRGPGYQGGGHWRTGGGRSQGAVQCAGNGLLGGKGIVKKLVPGRIQHRSWKLVLG